MASMCQEDCHVVGSGALPILPVSQASVSESWLLLCHLAGDGLVMVVGANPVPGMSLEMDFLH